MKLSSYKGMDIAKIVVGVIRVDWGYVQLRYIYELEVREYEISAS